MAFESDDYVDTVIFDLETKTSTKLQDLGVDLAIRRNQFCYDKFLANSKDADGIRKVTDVTNGTIFDSGFKESYYKREDIKFDSVKNRYIEAIQLDSGD